MPLGRALAAIAVAALAACNPAAVVEDVTAGAARSVVVNLLSAQYPRPGAEAAAACVLSAATPAEVQSLARDLGTRPGTLTEATVRTAAARPAAAACLAARGLAPVRL
jgi:hypothetical protein